MELDLTRDETDALSEALQIYLSELRYEIANTDKQDFRNELKRKRELLLAIHERLEPSTASHSRPPSAPSRVG